MTEAHSPKAVSAEESSLYREIALTMMDLAKASMEPDSTGFAYNPGRVISLGISAVLNGVAAFAQAGGVAGMAPDTDAIREIVRRSTELALSELPHQRTRDYLDELCLAFEQNLETLRRIDLEIAQEERGGAVLQ